MALRNDGGLRGQSSKAITALAAVGALVLVGCGGSSTANGESKKTGPVVAADAAAALLAANAVHVVGAVAQAGEDASFDLKLDGTSLTGQITVQGRPVMIISVGGKSYLKAAAQFWSSSGVPAGVAQKLNNRWVLVPPSENLASDLSLAKLAAQLKNPVHGPIAQQVKTGSVAGQNVVIVTDKSGNTVSVAAKGKPYPLRLSATGQDSSHLTFSDFGKHQKIAAPPNPLDANSFS